MELIIPARYNGPPASANGGYTCGLLAAEVAEPVEITLRSPPPLNRPLAFDGRELRDGRTLVAEVERAELHLHAPPPVSFEEAAEAARSYPGLEEHAYPTCFVCGPARDDGLALFTGPVHDGVFAAPWNVRESSRELVWAALDCPGAIGVGWDGRGDWLLGRMQGEVLDVPAVGEHCVVVAWPLGREGRKGFAGTAVYGEDERLLGSAKQTWIALR